VVRRAGRELNADWVVDDALPLADRLTANFARMAVHARAPSDAWRIHRRARAADQPDFDEVIDDYLRAITSSIALNHLGTPDPPPLVALALAGYLTFGVTVQIAASSRTWVTRMLLPDGSRKPESMP